MDKFQIGELNAGNQEPVNWCLGRPGLIQVVGCIIRLLLIDDRINEIIAVREGATEKQAAIMNQVGAVNHSALQQHRDVTHVSVRETVDAEIQIGDFVIVCNRLRVSHARQRVVGNCESPRNRPCINNRAAITSVRSYTKNEVNRSTT